MQGSYYLVNGGTTVWEEGNFHCKIMEKQLNESDLLGITWPCMQKHELFACECTSQFINVEISVISLMLSIA